jgi:hypothetical protein
VESDILGILVVDKPRSGALARLGQQQDVPAFNPPVLDPRSDGLFPLSTSRLHTWTAFVRLPSGKSLEVQADPNPCLRRPSANASRPN